MVRQSGGDFLITDGPYTETKEHLAGFWIINAADLDAALEWAKLATVAYQVPIEVRPFGAGHRRAAGGERGRRAVTISVQRP